MKVSYFAEAILALLVLSCSDTKHSISGQAPWNDGEVVFSYDTPDNVSIKDTCILKNGQFYFNVSVEDVVRGRLTFIHEDESPLKAFLFVENARLHVDIDMDSCVDFGSDRELRKTSVTGGPNNELAGVMDSILDSLSQDPYFAKMASSLKELEKEGYPEDKRTSFLNEFQSIYEEFSDSLTVHYRRAVLSHPDVEASAYYFRRYFRGLSLEEYESSFNQLSEKVRNCYLASEARQEIEAMKRTAPGAEAPDFSLKTRNGGNVTLSSFRGRYVIVDFWASWCGPCRAGMPAMKELYNKYHDSGLEIIGVSTDHRSDDWTKALDELDLPWVNVIDTVPAKNKPTETATRYGVHFIPSYFLIDKEGRIVGKLGHDDLESKLEELL